MVSETLFMCEGVKFVTFLKGEFVAPNSIKAVESGWFKKAILLNNINRSLIGKPKPIFSDGELTDTEFVHIRSDIYGRPAHPLYSARDIEGYNTLVTENATLRREVADLRRRLFTMKGGDRLLEAMTNLAKHSGKIRSSVITGNEKGFGRYSQRAGGVGLGSF